MKQVKKLLVILPLVALFVLGSLPVLAADGWTFTYDGKVVVADKVNEIQGFTKFENTKLIVKDDQDKLEEGADATAQGADYYLEVKGENSDGIIEVIVHEANSQSNPVSVSLKFKVDKGKNPGGVSGEGWTLNVDYYSDVQGTIKAEGRATAKYTLNKEFSAKYWDKEKNAWDDSFANINELAQSIGKFVMNQQPNGYVEVPNSFATAAEKFLKGSPEATVKLYLPQVVDNSKKVIAYDIHNNEFVMDRLYRLELNEYWDSPSDVAKAFYENSDSVKKYYLYAGFATQDKRPCIVYAATYLEKIAGKVYASALETYKADIIVFVVPRVIDIKTVHVFPEGTRDDLIEYVPVPYEVWASLQHSFKFMDLPGIFRTRIQKVNEMGFAFREVKFYNGINEITGLLSGYDWFDNRVTGDHNDRCVAKVFYDKAVAAAQEVPTEKKVDAATAPQAQLQAPAAQAQAQAPVTAANTTTTTAPVNTLPVTGASDSIFLFLSSAALMAVGILFFKKH